MTPTKAIAYIVGLDNRAFLHIITDENAELFKFEVDPTTLLRLAKETTEILWGSGSMVRVEQSKPG